MNAAKQFEKIGEETREKAERVKCSIPEFIEGLKEIIGVLEISIEAAEEDLRRKA